MRPRERYGTRYLGMSPRGEIAGPQANLIIHPRNGSLTKDCQAGVAEGGSRKIDVYGDQSRRQCAVLPQGSHFRPDRPSGLEADVIYGGRSLNRVDVDDVDPDSADACGEAARGDANVNAAPLSLHHVDAGDARHERGCGHAPEPRACDRAHAARPGAAKDRSPSIIRPAPTEA